VATDGNDRGRYDRARFAARQTTGILSLMRPQDLADQIAEQRAGADHGRQFAGAAQIGRISIKAGALLARRPANYAVITAINYALDLVPSGEG
jgi:hypothetical protein